MSASYSWAGMPAVTPSPPTHSVPPQIVYLNRPQRPRIPYTIKYTGHNLTAVKWVSGFQMFLAILCVVLQSISVIFNDNWNYYQRLVRDYSSDYSVYVYLNPLDVTGTGIWTGILMIIMAAVGIASWRQNRKALVITYQVLSAIIIPTSLILLGMTSSSVDLLRRCRQYGTYTDMYHYNHDDYYYYRTPSDSRITTTASPHVYFFGEDFGRLDNAGNKFYCRNPMFQAWLAVDAVMVVASVIMFILSLVSLIYSSKAACGNCCSCCGCCEPMEDMLPLGNDPQLWSAQSPYQHQHISISHTSNTQPPAAGPTSISNVSASHPEESREGKNSPPPEYTLQSS